MFDSTILTIISDLGPTRAFAALMLVIAILTLRWIWTEWKSHIEDARNAKMLAHYRQLYAQSVERLEECAKTVNDRERRITELEAELQIIQARLDTYIISSNTMNRAEIERLVAEAKERRNGGN